jgi:hypothetical protein
VPGARGCAATRTSARPLASYGGRDRGYGDDSRRYPSASSADPDRKLSHPKKKNVMPTLDRDAASKATLRVQPSSPMLSREGYDAGTKLLLETGALSQAVPFKQVVVCRFAGCGP